MPAEYLAPAEYAAYGLPTGTSAALIQRASAMIDAMLDRKKGIVWVPDGNGSPCYMANAVPAMTWALRAAITAGDSVTVAFNGRPPSSLVGQPVLLDRAKTDAVEASVVTEVDDANVTLASVQFDHDLNTTVEAGVFCEAQATVQGIRPSIFVRERPVIAILAARVRATGGPVGLADQLDDERWDWPDQAPAPEVSTGWRTLDPTTIDFDPSTGQVFVPTGNYAEVRLHYVSGYSASAIPSQIKMACAQIVSVLSGDGAADPKAMDRLKEAFAVRRVGI